MNMPEWDYPGLADWTSPTSMIQVNRSAKMSFEFPARWWYIATENDNASEHCNDVCLAMDHGNDV